MSLSAKTLSFFIICLMMYFINLLISIKISWSTFSTLIQTILSSLILSHYSIIMLSSFWLMFSWNNVWLPVAVGGLVVSTDRGDSLRVIAGWSGVRIPSRARELLFLPPYHHQTCRGVACGLTKWSPAIIAQRCSCLSQATGLI